MTTATLLRLALGACAALLAVAKVQGGLLCGLFGHAGACRGMISACFGAQVQVELYGEALCPYCAKFLGDTAAPLFYEGFSPHMDFR